MEDCSEPKAILHIQGCCSEAVAVQLYQSVIVCGRHGNEMPKDQEGCGAGIAAMGKVKGVLKTQKYGNRKVQNLF